MKVKTLMFVFLCLLQCGACMDYPLDIFEELENKILDIQTSMFQMKSSFNLKLKRISRKTVNIIATIAKKELSNIIDDKVRSGEIQKTVDGSFNTQLQSFQHQLQQMKNVFRLNIRSNDKRRAVNKSTSEYEKLSKEVKNHGILFANVSEQLDDLKLLKKEVNTHGNLIGNVSNQLDDVKLLKKEVNTHGIIIANVSEQLDDLNLLKKEVNNHEILFANVSEHLDDVKLLSEEVNTHEILIANVSEQLDDLKLLKKEVNTHETLIANVSHQLDDVKLLKKEVNTHGILFANVSDRLDDVKLLKKEVNTHEILIAYVSEHLDDLEMLTKEVNTHGIVISHVSDQLDDLKILTTKVNTHGILISNVSDQLDELKIKKKERLTPDTKNGLEKACEDGNLDLVKDILSTGHENINQKGKMGRTPVMTSARSGHYEVFTFLVSQGCDPTTVDYNKDNVLHLACKGGNGNIVRELLRYDHLGLESRGKKGRTPVMYAAYFGHTGLVELLERKGSNLRVTDNDKDNILHVACIGGDLSMIEYILSKNIVGIDSRDKRGRTPIMTAAFLARQDVVEFLVSRGSNVTVRDNNKNNILHLAVSVGAVDVVRYLLTLGYNLKSARNVDGYTPLNYAIWLDHTQIVELLKS